MKLSRFDYHLPKELIAKKPANPRDSARLFVYNRLDKKSVHTKFNQIDKFLNQGDVLVLNDTRVIPARLIGRRIIASPSLRGGTTKQSRGSKGLPRPEYRARNDILLGRKFKILLLGEKSQDVWTALIDGRGREIGLRLFFAKELQGEIIKKQESGIWEIRFNKSGKRLEKYIFELGKMPLPPYIKQENTKTQKQKNNKWYQTVYAKYIGSVAAPTAGLHFTERLLKKLKKKGIQIEYITLHVGMGTFMPVKSENIKKHKMHSEFASIDKETAKRLNKAKKSGKRIVSVGTTSTRTLEAFAAPAVIPAKAGISAKNKIPQQVRDDSWFLKYGSKNVDIFIYPPYKFKFIDGIITNFHLPKSTLIMMISAFLKEGDIKGIKLVQEIYKEAIKKKYKFYSYGDAMLIE